MLLWDMDNVIHNISEDRRLWMQFDGGWGLASCYFDSLRLCSS